MPRHPALLRCSRRCIATLAAAFASLAQAADFYKADNESNLNTIAAWVNADNSPVAAAPGNITNATDSWVWDNRVAGAAVADGVQNLAMGGDLGVLTIRIADPAHPIVIDGGGNRSITVNSNGGIDMSAATQDLTLQNLNGGSNVGFRLSNGSVNYAINVAAGRTLTFGTGAKIAVRNGGSNTTVTFAGPGKVVFNDQFQSSHAVINGGRVEFNRASGTSRIATASPNPPAFTTVNAGVLMVNNTSGSATGASEVTVNDTATLGGAGIISGPVTLNSGATLSPGNDAVGSLSIGTLTLASGSKVVWEAANTASSDLISVTGSDGLTINGGVISLRNPGTSDPFSGTGLYNLITYTGSLGGAGLEALTIDEASKIPGRTYTLSLGAGAITLRITSGSVVTRDWAVDASGNWSDTANWTGGAVPDAAETIARVSGSTGATLTAPRTVTLDAPRTVGQLYLDAAQPVTLAGSAPLTLNDGGATATLGSSGADHLVSAPISLTTGGVLASVEGGANSLTLAGAISGDALGLSKIGAGTLVLAADNTYTGTTLVASGTLQIGTGGTTGSVAGPLSSSGAIRFNRSDAVTLSAPIAGSGSVNFVGSGSTTLSVANTYSGTTSISAGSLVIGHASALQNSTLNYSVSGGSLSVADGVASLVLGGLSGDRALPLSNTAAVPVVLPLTVGGNNSSTTYSGSPIGTGDTFTKTGSGTLTLTGTHTYAGNTSVSAGTLSIDAGGVFTTAAANLATGAATSARIRVNGGTLNASAQSSLLNNTGGIVVAGGTANFDGGINNIYAETANAFINVSGGVLNAASITLGRGNASTTSEPGTAANTHGLYVNGGTVNVSGALTIGRDNSSTHSRIDSGAINVAGLLTVGINNTGRWSILDVNGGSLTSTDAPDPENPSAPYGLALGGATAGNVVMQIRGSDPVVSVPKIQFGQAALAGKSYLNLAAGSLYVGSGGLVIGSSAPSGTGAGQFDAAIRASAGTIGATADWSSTIPLVLNGVLAVTGADPANTPHTVTMSGPLSGLGSLTKTGAGTVLFPSTLNDYFGPTDVSAGVLGLGGRTTFTLAVNSGGTFVPQGVFNASFGATVDGTLRIDYNSAAPTPVGRLVSDAGAITLGASSSLSVSGTGALPGPAYVLVKASGGVSGTFANVTLPAGFTLDYAYDDDNDGGTPPVIAMIGGSVQSPYETWAASFSLTGDDALASADPDADGLVNLLEYAFDTSPILSDASSAYLLDQTGNHLRITFDHPADATLTYAIEASNTLATDSWSVVHTFPAFITEGTDSYTDTAVDLTVTPRRFLRVKVTPAP